MAREADSVVIATPIEAVNRRSSEGNLFTEIIFTDAQAFNNGRLQFVDSSFTIYLWGGVRDVHGNVATLKTPPPHVLEYLGGTPQLEFGTPHLFYLRDNGQVGMPFENSEFGVYIILDSGRLLSSDKSLKVVLSTDSKEKKDIFVQSVLEQSLRSANAENSIDTVEAESIEIRDATIDDLIEMIGDNNPRFIDPIFFNNREELAPIFIE